MKRTDEKLFKVICTISINDGDDESEYSMRSQTCIKTLSETKAYRMFGAERKKTIDIYNSTLAAKRIYMRVELYENDYLCECYGTKYNPKIDNYSIGNIL